MRNEFATSFGRLARAEGGNVAIFFALTLLGMIGVVGIGIDLSKALAAKTTLDAAADAAALAAVTEAAASLASTTSGYTNNTAAAIIAGQNAGSYMFTADATKIGNALGATPTPTITVNQSGQTLTATVSYSASSPNSFGGMFKTPTLGFSGTSTSSLTLPKYMNITVAIDTSQSMGLASTTAYQNQLLSVTNGTCAFGCHAVQSGQYGSTSYEAQAHAASPYIPLRVDVIKGATQTMIQSAAALPNGTSLISFGVYTFNTTLKQIDAPGTSGTSGYAQLENDVGNTNFNQSPGKIDLDSSTDTNGYGDTNFGVTTSPGIMQTLTNDVPVSGTGATASSPQQFVFIMSDGVQDVYGNGPNDNTAHTYAGGSTPSFCPASSYTTAYIYNHCTTPFDPAQCAALKAKNVTVGVIYTTYLSMPGVWEWVDLVEPFSSQIAINMQACATPGWYFQATQASDIQAAVNALFSKATSQGVLTQ